MSHTSAPVVEQAHGRLALPVTWSDKRPHAIRLVKHALGFAGAAGFTALCTSFMSKLPPDPDEGGLEATIVFGLLTLMFLGFCAHRIRALFRWWRVTERITLFGYVKSVRREGYVAHLCVGGITLSAQVGTWWGIYPGHYAVIEYVPGPPLQVLQLELLRPDSLRDPDAPSQSEEPVDDPTPTGHSVA